MAEARLAVDYLGLPLRSPLVAAASPLTLRLDNLRALEDAGAGAVVLGSLFEENCRGGKPGCGDGPWLGPVPYLDLVARAKAALTIPVIASLNAASIGAWVHHAPALEHSGADAIELDLAFLAVDPDVPSARIERDYLDVVAAVRLQTTLPLSVKLPAAFTSVPAVLAAMARAGAAGAVLFHQSYQPDLDLGLRRLVPRAQSAAPSLLGQVLRWLALLHGRVALDLAASGGVHTGADALKVIAAGARVAMVCSVLLRHGVGHMRVLASELLQAMDQFGCAAAAEWCGVAAGGDAADQARLERAHYLAMVQSQSARGGSHR